MRAHWADSVQESFKSELEISAVDRQRPHGQAPLAEMHLFCYAISARQLSDGRATMSPTIGINSIEHLNTVLGRLRKICSVTSVTRV